MAKTTVLCVDDDRTSLECRRLLLSSAGYDVLTANSGPEALAMFRPSCVDLIIVDYTMPGMDGGVVAWRLKATAPHVPVLMISGEDQIPARALLWVDEFISKGENPTKFLTAVRNLLTTASPFTLFLRAQEADPRTTHSVKEP